MLRILAVFRGRASQPASQPGGGGFQSLPATHPPLGAAPPDDTRRKNAKERNKRPNLATSYMRRLQKYELVGPWRQDHEIKEKAGASKPAASTSNVSSSSSSSSSATSISSAPQNNIVEDDIVLSDAEDQMVR